MNHFGFRVAGGAGRVKAAAEVLVFVWAALALGCCLLLVALFVLD